MAFDFDYERLKFAWEDASRGKRNAPNQQRYRYDLEDNLYALLDDLKNDGFTPSPLREKPIYYPKFRIAQVPSLEDKIVQHTFIDGYGYQALTKPIIPEASACLRQRGEKYAVKLFRNQLRHFYNQHGCRPLILKCDIRSYFASIPHDRVEALIARYVQDETVRRVLLKFVRMTDKGLPLGLQQSQLLANLYLSEMDHTLKERHGVKFYGRYMDDFYIMSDSLEELQKLLAWIKGYLESIGLELNPKTAIFESSVDYLGFTFKMTPTGKIVMRLRKDKVKTQKRWVRKLAEMLGRGEITAEYAGESYHGWREHASHGDCGNMIRAMDKRYAEALRKVGYRLIITKKRVIVCREPLQTSHQDKSCTSTRP